MTWFSPRVSNVLAGHVAIVSGSVERLLVPHQTQFAGLELIILYKQDHLCFRRCQKHVVSWWTVGFGTLPKDFVNQTLRGHTVLRMDPGSSRPVEANCEVRLYVGPGRWARVGTSARHAPWKHVRRVRRVDNKKLLLVGAKGIATRSKVATRGSWPYVLLGARSYQELGTRSRSGGSWGW